MSEYQYVAFRAIDRPVSKDNLRYMQKQSTRAEITEWSFSNEYHFGDFGGDALGMLRRGYDFHFHYANYGTRTLMIRLSNGLPNDKAAQKYLDGESFRFERDKSGKGGSLVIEPAYESGDLEELWDIDELVDRLVPIRAEILAGDLRPLYLAQLAMGLDFNHDPEEMIEGPVPAGLDSLSVAQLAMAEVYGLSPSLLAAAAQGTPEMPTGVDGRTQYALWIRNQPTETKDRWLSELICDPHSVVRIEIEDAFRKEHSAADWPVVELNRSIDQLRQEAEPIANRMELERAERAARERAQKLATMAADPKRYLSETEKLVATFTTRGYDEAAELLADLREALAGTPKSGLPEAHAQKLRRDYPTKNQLTSALRRAGLVKKEKAKSK